MADLTGRDDIEALGDDLSELGRSLRSSFRHYASSFRNNSALSNSLDEETALQWAAIERLPTFDRLKSSLFDENGGNEGPKTNRKRVIDVTKLGALERHVFIDNLIKRIEDDNLRLLQKIRKRLDKVRGGTESLYDLIYAVLSYTSVQKTVFADRIRDLNVTKLLEKVGIELPTVEVRYSNLHVEAEVKVVDGKPLPTLWNSLKSSLPDLPRLAGLKSEMCKIKIIDGVSGVLKPKRMTLLLGPPGSGKTSLLKALSGNTDKSLKAGGEISYNGYRLDEFVAQKTSAYISQNDLHISDMTVRETLDFSSCCQGVGNREEMMAELSRREKEAGICPDPDIDTYMKAISAQGQKAKLQTDYILKILGLDICADTRIGDVMRRGISGGQKKRLTTGEMIVGPAKALFMDEISNGLDSSTTYQIVSCLQQLAHITDATILISLLQPAPEIFELFDDIILLAEGKIVYHGPRTNVLDFFECCGFRCPERKGIADFLQEVISENDQAQYWNGNKNAYSYRSVSMLSVRFKESTYGKRLEEDIFVPLAKSKKQKGAINFSVYSLPKWSLFKACFAREFLLMKRNSFVYVFKSFQLLTIAFITMTVFLRTRMGRFDLVDASYYMGALFFSLSIFLIDGFPEGPLNVARLAVFYKQRDLNFYPAWAYAIPSVVLRIPLSMLAATIWTCLTYFVIGYSPDIPRFFRQLILLFSVHLTSISMFRFLASVTRTLTANNAIGGGVFILSFTFSGYIIPRPSMPVWLKWGFWVSPLTYGEIGLTINEFSSPRWQKMLPTNTTVGHETLEMHGLNFRGYVIWIAVGALFGFTILFNFGFTLALTFLKSPASRAIISRKKFAQMNKHNESDHSKENSINDFPLISSEPREGRMVLPFEPLTVAFQDLQYYVETPLAMKEHGFAHKRLQLLQDITGTFRPGVLTALMGVSGAGKTTLFDVLAGRKTSGTIEGEIKIGGYPKVKKTFARISGYCEQSDIHSSNITVNESIVFSAWLRLHPDIDSETKYNFVKEVLETVELEGIKDALVGSPGVNGLSTEERKRLTIAVELVANPSIVFLDEPTTGLDARAAAIVMRAVKRVTDTGRTIVCTIHQPSIDIFEAFDEIILLKSGGRMIYSGHLGQNSSKIIEYFESISGVPKIRKNYNPATWIMEVTSMSSEAELGIDFAEIYQHSVSYQENKELAKRLSSPPSGSKVLAFPSTYSQNFWGQFKACLWKQYWSYWRSPSYNLRRLMFIVILSLLFGALFFNKARKIHNQLGLSSIIGSMYAVIVFCGVNNTASIMPYVSTERVVFYRERFAGMYTFRAYSLAQAVVEFPYVFVQTVIFTCITYPMIGYQWSVYKFAWYFYTMFSTLLSYSYLGMMIVSLSPSYPVASILQSAFYAMFHLFSGFLMPPKHIPKWWIWLHYLIPTSWSLRGLVTSQYGDSHKEIEVFGGTKTTASFLGDYFGFHNDQLPLIGVALLLFPISFASVYAYCLGHLKFQKR